MRSLLSFFLALLTLTTAAASGARAQTAVQPTPGALGPAEIDRIIRAFTAKETEFRKALNRYTFTRDALMQTVGFGGQVSGEYNRVSAFTFNDAGERFERITRFPVPTLTEISFTNEDLEDLGGVQPFALEASKLDKYNFTYVGREQLDELSTHVFDVAPKVTPKKVSERFFKGRIWVEERDLQIVKVKGKGVPEGKQRFPVFETYREQVDGKFWFPTYTYADDQLVFEGGQTVHVRMKVRYADYKLFRGRVRVVEEGDPGDVPEN